MEHLTANERVRVVCRADVSALKQICNNLAYAQRQRVFDAKEYGIHVDFTEKDPDLKMAEDFHDRLSANKIAFPVIHACVEVEVPIAIVSLNKTEEALLDQARALNRYL